MITASELSNFLSSADISAELADSNYSLPDGDWINGEFANALHTFLSNLGISYEAEKSDCDDFARFAASYCGLLHSKMSHSTGIAFGEFWFTRDNGNGHAINVFVTRDANEKLTLRFFEPQTQSELHLSDEEINSCDYCRF